MAYSSINPYTAEVLERFDLLSASAIESKINKADIAQRHWRNVSVADRAELLLAAADVMEKNVDSLATLITLEMGKLFVESKAEIIKCAACFRYYAGNGEAFLADIPVLNNAKSAFVRFEPLGVILAIMPWNFPFWQAVRFLAPALMAGNGGLLKHASNVPQCALALEQIMLEAGFPEGLFQNLFISTGQVAEVLKHPVVKAATLTGSEGAGRAVAENAGKNLKKLVLELGGSDPFIVLPPADVTQVAKKAAKARMINAGQSCIAAKRFIVHHSIIEEFVYHFSTAFQQLKYGDPFSPETTLAALARTDLVTELHSQTIRSLDAGAKLISGARMLGFRNEAYEPTIIWVQDRNAAVWSEETFGPVAAIFVCNDEDDAVSLANDSAFGLGSSVWTDDEPLAYRVASQLEVGAVFINEIVKSDPSVPFGGVKNSGYGRELSSFGMREFLNIKTIWQG